MDCAGTHTAPPPPSDEPLLTDAEIEAMRLWLPFPMRDVADRFGNLVALRLAEGFGGRQIYLPTTPDPRHDISRRVGVEVLRFLIEHPKIEKGVTFALPTCAQARNQIRVAEVATLLRLGARRKQIAERYGLHVRTASVLIRAARNSDADAPKGKCMTTALKRKMDGLAMRPVELLAKATDTAARLQAALRRPTMAEAIRAAEAPAEAASSDHPAGATGAASPSPERPA